MRLLLSHSFSRRAMISSSAAAALASHAVGQTPREPVLRTEEQQGDPDMKPETVTFDPEKIAAVTASVVQGSIAPRTDAFAEKLVAAAEGCLGMNREENEADITRFLNLFHLPFRDGANGPPIAYCAAGASYVAALAYVRSLPGADAAEAPDLGRVRSMLLEIGAYHFQPTVSVIDMYNVAVGTRRFVARSKSPRPGSLVIFDWKKKGGANHVGIVTSMAADRSSIQTIEFNTTLPGGAGSQRDGGYVARRNRNWNETITGFIDLNVKGVFG